MTNNTQALQARHIGAWANKLPLDFLADDYNKYSIKNGRNDKKWYVQNDADSTFYVVNWENYHVEDKWKGLAKTVFLNYCGGYVDVYQNITTRISSLKTFLGDMKRLLEGLSKYSNCNLLSDLSMDEFAFVLRKISVKPDGSPKACQTCSGFLKVAHKIRDFHDDGLISDGFSFSFPVSDQKFFYLDFIKSQGLNYEDWRARGSYGGAPVAIAMNMLAHCFKYFNHPKTKLAVHLFEVMRARIPLGVYLEGVSRYVDTGSWNSLIAAQSDCYSEELARLHFEFEQISGVDYLDIQFSGKSDLLIYAQEVYDAGLLILTTLSGYRISELRHLRPSDLKRKDERGNWIVHRDNDDLNQGSPDEQALSSKLIKTNYGIGTIRSISSCAVPVVETLIGLSLYDKRALDRPIFQFNYFTSQRDIHKAVPYNTALRMLKRGYRSFLSKQDKSFEEALGDLSPHNLRHTWVDIALRCFLPERSHSVLTEEIRHHLRHQYGSTWTNKYLANKFTPVMMRELEEGYLSDLVVRMNDDVDSEFYGPVVVRIKKMVRERVEFIGMDEVAAKEQVIEDMQEDLLHLQGHPWGLCVLMKDTQTQAKCYDKVNQVPSFDENSGFENCISCVHRLSHKSQVADIQRYVLAHEDFVENYPLDSKSFKKVSKEAARVGRLLLKEMDNE
jgi:integrase